MHLLIVDIYSSRQELSLIKIVGQGSCFAVRQVNALSLLVNFSIVKFDFSESHYFILK